MCSTRTRPLQSSISTWVPRRISSPQGVEDARPDFVDATTNATNDLAGDRLAARLRLAAKNRSAYDAGLASSSPARLLLDHRLWRG